MATRRCLGTYWLLAWHAYGARQNATVLSSAGTQTVWLSEVMEDHEYASGLLYRRTLRAEREPLPSGRPPSGSGGDGVPVA